MKNKLSKYIEIREVAMMAGLIIVTFILGMLLHDFLVNNDIKNMEEEITVFPLGSFISIIAMLVALCFVGATAMCQDFGMIVGMGATRKEFFLKKVINLGITTVISIIIFVILNRIEMIKLNTMWSEYPLELDFSPYITGKNIFIAIVVLIGMSLFVSAFILKFGKTGFWIIWGLYMIFCLSLSRASDIVSAIKPETINSMSAKSNMIMVALFILAVSGTAVSWLIVRRQEVV